MGRSRDSSPIQGRTTIADRLKTSEPLDELNDGFFREVIAVPNSRVNDARPTECRDLRSLAAKIDEVVTNENAVDGRITVDVVNIERAIMQAVVRVGLKP